MVTFLIRKNVCSKQALGCFLIYLAAFLIQKPVFKTSGRLLLIYLATFLIRENVCSKQVGVRGGRCCWTSYQIFKKGYNLTCLFIAFIQASLLSLLLLPGSLLQDTLLFNLDWFEQLFAQQLTSFVLLKFSLLNYELNKVCMIKM